MSLVSGLQEFKARLHYIVRLSQKTKIKEHFYIDIFLKWSQTVIVQSKYIMIIRSLENDLMGLSLQYSDYSSIVLTELRSVS